MRTITIPHVDNLYFAEVGKDIPFAIERMFFVNCFTGHRGGHANRKVEEFVFVVKGKVKFTLEHEGVKESITLDSPEVGLYVGNNTWIEIESVEDDSIYVVAANEPYNRDDYIGDYEEFKKL